MIQIDRGIPLPSAPVVEPQMAPSPEARPASSPESRAKAQATMKRRRAVRAACREAWDAVKVAHEADDGPALMAAVAALRAAREAFQ